MRSIAILLFCIMKCCLGYAQQVTTIHGKDFLRVSDYKTIYGKLTREDTVNFHFLHNDTLVLLKRPIRRVKFEYRDSNFLNIYKSVAFNDQFKNNNNIVYHRYWKQQVNIFLSGRVNKNVSKQFRQFASDLVKGVDSLKIKFVNNDKEANYVIYCTGDKEYDINLADSKNDFYIYWNDINQYTTAFVKLNTNVLFNDKMQISVLKTIFLKTLGNFALTDKIDCENYFSICGSDNKQVSSLDRQLLKYHYSYGICKGLSKSDFEEMHRNAIEFRKMNRNEPLYIGHPN